MNANPEPVDTGIPPSLPQVTNLELLRRIGKGSYGEVFLARGLTASYRAVKLVYRSRFDDNRPFEREFVGLKHFEPISTSEPTQVSILQVERTNDLFYYVMELADDQITGTLIRPETYAPRTLKSDLQKKGKLLPSEAIAIAIQLATALQCLHEHRLVHRDIKIGRAS